MTTKTTSKQLWVILLPVFGLMFGASAGLALNNLGLGLLLGVVAGAAAAAITLRRRPRS
jgi:hypothetical protein